MSTSILPCEQRVNVLLAMHQYNTDIARQYFDYRERLTATAVLAYAGLLTAAVSLNLSIMALPIPVLIMVISRLCEFFLMKFFERSEYHFSRARKIRDQLDVEFGADFLSIGGLFRDAAIAHRQGFDITGRKKWTQPILNANTHDKWGSLHRLFFWSGLLCALGILVKAVVDGGYWDLVGFR